MSTRKIHLLKARGIWTQFVGPLRALEDFRTSGDLRGDVVHPWNHVPTGRLPDDWARTFTARRGVIDYVVSSWFTPIAWHDKETGWVVPDERYSQTTTNHQNKIHTALGSFADQVTEEIFLASLATRIGTGRRCTRRHPGPGCVRRWVQRWRIGHQHRGE